MEHASISRFRVALTARGGRGGSSSSPTRCTPPRWRPTRSAARSARSPTACCSTPAGEPVLILTSGAHRVDTVKVAAAIGVGSLDRAKPEFVRAHTGQVIGGVSPIAHPAPVRTYLDPSLRQYDEIWAAAGHPAAVFSTTYDELLAMTGATEIEVA